MIYVDYGNGVRRLFSEFILSRLKLPRDVNELREATREWAESMPENMDVECSRVIR